MAKDKNKKKEKKQKKEGQEKVSLPQRNSLFFDRISGMNKASTCS